MPEASPRPVERLERPTLDVPRLDTGSTYAKEAYAALKRAITAMDIYGHPHEIRLDERRLSEGLGVSRTPIREAMTLLEQEGFVRTLSAPRHLCRAQDQARNRRDHHGHGGARKHGGAARRLSARRRGYRANCAG